MRYWRTEAHADGVKYRLVIGGQGGALTVYPLNGKIGILTAPTGPVLSIEDWHKAWTELLEAIRTETP